MAEQRTVNPFVVGSSPTLGAKKESIKMDKATAKWWIDHSRELEEENLILKRKLEAALDTLAYQEVEMRRLERLQPY